MRLSPRLLLGLTVLALTCGGCASTGKLGGTQWSVIEIIEPDESDRADIQKIDALLVEFRPDGHVITTTLYNDGTARITKDERYKVNGDVIEFEGPDYELVAMYRMDGQNLRLHSEQFVYTMAPIKP